MVSDPARHGCTRITTRYTGREWGETTTVKGPCTCVFAQLTSAGFSPRSLSNTARSPSSAALSTARLVACAFRQARRRESVEPGRYRCAGVSSQTNSPKPLPLSSPGCAVAPYCHTTCKRHCCARYFSVRCSAQGGAPQRRQRHAGRGRKAGRSRQMRRPVRRSRAGRDSATQESDTVWRALRQWVAESRVEGGVRRTDIPASSSVHEGKPRRPSRRGECGSPSDRLSSKVVLQATR